jgi:hypothetical protein
MFIDASDSMVIMVVSPRFLYIQNEILKTWFHALYITLCFISGNGRVISDQTMYRLEHNLIALT